MNPRANHFCSACGHQLVDAYHASEGLRVYATPDPGAALVEILDSGTDIAVIPTDEELPADFVKIALADGRIGYVRLREVESDVDGAEPTRREPVGCITSTSILAILALMILTAALVLAIAVQTSDDQGGLIAALACLIVVPFLVLVAGFYFYVRKREDELLAGDDEQAAGVAQRAGDLPGD
jgi:hypothetical protein